MSYDNFIPTIWAEAINRELSRITVFEEDCYREIGKGNARQLGDSVKILGIGRPTITVRTLADKKNPIPDLEEIETSSVTLVINQQGVFHYGIDDVSKKMSVKGVMEKIRGETTEGLANEQDRHIASMAAEDEAIKLFSTAETIDANNVLEAIDEAQRRLWEKDVRRNTELVLTVSPSFYMLLRQKLTNIDTDNSDRIAKGYVGKYGGITVKMSNNVAKDENENDLIMLRTKRAVAFVRPYTHIEIYRPEKYFVDAIKGYVIYQAKIVRPKEMVVLNVNYGSSSSDSGSGGDGEGQGT